MTQGDRTRTFSVEQTAILERLQAGEPSTGTLPTWVPVYVERAIYDLIPDSPHAREIARVAWMWDDLHPGYENQLYKWQNEAIRQRRDLIALTESRADRLGAEEEATGRVICNDCGGYQMFKCEGNTIRVFHDCYTGKHSRESFRKLTDEIAELRKRCEAYQMLNLGLQEMLDVKACPDCHKQNS